MDRGGRGTPRSAGGCIRPPNEQREAQDDRRAPSEPPRQKKKTRGRMNLPACSRRPLGSWRLETTAPDVFQSSEPTISPEGNGHPRLSSLPSSGRYVRASAGGKAPPLFTRVAWEVSRRAARSERSLRSGGCLSLLSRATNASITTAGALSPMRLPSERSNARPSEASRERYPPHRPSLPSRERGRPREKPTHAPGRSESPPDLGREGGRFAFAFASPKRPRPFSAVPSRGVRRTGSRKLGRRMPSPALRSPTLPSSPLRGRGARRSRTDTAIDEQNRYSSRGPMHPWERAPSDETRCWKHRASETDD